MSRGLLTIKKGLETKNRQETMFDAEGIKRVTKLDPAVLHYLCKDYSLNFNAARGTMGLALMVWVSNFDALY